MAGLTERQKRFIEEYMIDLNATQAAIRAGYSAKSAGTDGPRLLENAGIRARLDVQIAERARRTGVNADRVIRELARVAFLNPQDAVDLSNATVNPDATPDDTAAIASVRVKKTPTPDGMGIEREIRFADKLKSLELLGRHLGMLNDKQKIELTLPVVIAGGDNLED